MVAIMQWCHFFVQPGSARMVPEWHSSSHSKNSSTEALRQVLECHLDTSGSHWKCCYHLRMKIAQTPMKSIGFPHLPQPSLGNLGKQLFWRSFHMKHEFCVFSVTAAYPAEMLSQVCFLTTFLHFFKVEQFSFLLHIISWRITVLFHECFCYRKNDKTTPLFAPPGFGTCDISSQQANMGWGSKGNRELYLF